MKLIALPLEDSATIFHYMQECLHRFLCLLFSLFLVPIPLYVVCALFLLVTADVYLNSVRFKHIDSSCHFLELSYRGLNHKFLKLAQLLNNVDIESNSEPTNLEKFHVHVQRKLKFLKERKKT